MASYEDLKIEFIMLSDDTNTWTDTGELLADFHYEIRNIQ